MKPQCGVDAGSGLVHTVWGTWANVNDVVTANSLLHGQEIDGYGDAGYQGANARYADADKRTQATLSYRHEAQQAQSLGSPDPISAM